MLLRSLLVASIAEAKALGLKKALKHSWGSLRALRHPRASFSALKRLRLLGMNRWLPKHERLFHIRHRFYLSQRLSTLQRTAAVLHHYDYEARTFVPSYHRLVYGGRGLVLWRAEVDGVDFRIRLSASDQLRWEGDLSIEVFANETRVHVVSFTYVDAALFGLPSAPTMFITRNQSMRDEPGWSLFRAAFKNTVPSYFGLAATIGVAAGNGMHQVAAIGHEAQIAYEPEIAATLKNSYDEFWRTFQAAEVEDGHVFLLPAPMALAPLSTVKAKHRKRAADRREAWSAIAASSHAAILARIAREPAPDTDTATESSAELAPSAAAAPGGASSPFGRVRAARNMMIATATVVADVADAITHVVI
ncbi:MAG TPA: DUF535 family protein [Burkholderiaceae bacterium]|jgi:uncharacterized protein VirK/YbjX